MATTIQHKRSTTASAVPISSDLAVGELAVNTADGILFTKHSDNSIVPIVSSSDAAAKLTAEVKNLSGGTLTKGTPVYINGATGNTFHVDAVRADSEGKMPASGILSQDLASNADGLMVISGFINGLDTSGFTAGDAIYVASTGGYTNIAPSGENNFIQKLGIVSKVDSDNGALLLQGAGRANATPNLDEDQFFLGNSSNQSVATDFSDAVEAISINNVSEDTTPQLGGDLDTNGNDIKFGDNDKATFGAGDDLEIYHDGSNSIISDTGTGNLKVLSNTLQIMNVLGDENGLVVRQNADVELYYNGSEKLATTSSGVDVTGNITVSGTVDGRDIATDGTTLDAVALTYVDVSGDTMTGNLNFGDDVRIQLGDNNDLRLFHNGTRSFVQDSGAGSLVLDTNGDDVRITHSTNAETMAVFTKNGSVLLKYDGADKLETTSSGVDVTGTITFDGGTTSADLAFNDGVKAKFGISNALQVFHNGNGRINNVTGDIIVSNYVEDADVRILTDDGSGGLTNYFRADGSTGEVILYHYGSEKLATKSTGIDVTGTMTADGLTINNYSFPTADGSANQVLTTDGVGNITFVDAASGGASEDFAIAMAVALG